MLETKALGDMCGELEEPNWLEELEELEEEQEPIDMELLEPEFEKEALCPCEYGICDEKESCPLYK